MSVYKDIDIDLQDLQELVRTNRNSHFNTPLAGLSRDEAELEQRANLATKLLRAGWIMPTYANSLKYMLRRGERAKAMTLLVDVLGLDADILTTSQPEELQRANKKLNWDDVRFIRRAVELKLTTQVELAKKFDVSSNAVNDIVSGRSWIEEAA